MRMLWDNVLVKPLEKKNKIIIADKQGSIPDRAEVIAVGPGDWYGYKEFVPTKVKAKDKVFFFKDRAHEVEIKDVKYYVVRERDVLGVLDEKEVG